MLEKKYKAMANQLQVTKYTTGSKFSILKISWKEMEYQLREQLKLNHNLEESKRKQIKQNQELLKHYEEKESQVFEHIRKR